MSADLSHLRQYINWISVKDGFSIDAFSMLSKGFTLIGGSSGWWCCPSLLLHTRRMWRTFKIVRQTYLKFNFKIENMNLLNYSILWNQIGSIQICVLTKKMSKVCIKWVITLLPLTHWTCWDLGKPVTKPSWTQWEYTKQQTTVEQEEKPWMRFVVLWFKLLTCDCESSGSEALAAFLPMTGAVSPI